MPLKYVAYTPGGERVTGWVEWGEITAAEAALWERGLIIVSLKKVIRWPSLYTLMPTFFKVKTRNVISFLRQLATLLDSGLPLLSAINILREQVGHPLFKQALEEVRRDIEAGNSFSKSLEKHPTIFSFLLVRMVRVAEETGNIQPILNRVADYMEKQEVLAARVKKALTYPGIVLAVGIIAIYILITYSIPAMSGLLKEFGAQLPLTTRILLGVSGFISKNTGALFLIPLILAGLTYFFLGRSANRRRRTRLIMRLPLLGTILFYESLSRLIYSLSFLLSAGVSFRDGLELLVMTTENPVLNDALKEVHSGILEGQRFSQVLSRLPLFPSLVVQMVAVGEETGRMESNLSLLGKFYEEDTERRLSGLTSLIEPAIIVGLGFMVGFIAISVMGALYGMIKQIR